MDLVEAQRGVYETEPLFDMLKREVGKEAFIAGGYARWMCSPCRPPAAPTDIDVFTTSPEVALTLANWCHGQRLRRLTRRPLNASWVFPGLDVPLSIQYRREKYTNQVICLHGTPEQVISAFDFTVVAVAMTTPTKGICVPEFQQHERAKMLHFQCIQYPILVPGRVTKYQALGYKLPSLECLNLFDALATMPEQQRAQVRYCHDAALTRNVTKARRRKYEHMELVVLLSHSLQYASGSTGLHVGNYS
jgi:hypothetical protein